jgi:hypothetical protein
MPPKKRTVEVRRGRPPLPPEIRQSRQKRSIGVVEQADWDRWRLAAQVTGIPTTEFINLHVNRAANEILAGLTPQQLSAAKRKRVKSESASAAKAPKSK